MTTFRRLRILSVSVFLIVSGAASAVAAWSGTGGPRSFDAGGDETYTSGSVVFQDDAAARADDIGRLAAETGLSVAEAERAIGFQERFEQWARGLIDRYPDQIAAIWVDPVPAAVGYVRFAGEVPPGLAEEAAALDLEVSLQSGPSISSDDWARRVRAVALAVKSMGYRDVVVFHNVSSDRIEVEFKLPDTNRAPTANELAAAATERLQSAGVTGPAADVQARDVRVVVFPGDGPFVVRTHTRGGNWMLDDSARECTSGWSVSGPNGNGVLTAGHCSGINKFEQPGVTPYSAPWKDEEYGLRGDVEYHTTSHIELAEFYASASTIRDVTSLQATSTMNGKSVCFYGRASNSRTCNHTVTAVDVVVVDDNGVTVGELARATNDSSQPGDSGGGWSWGTTAFGVQHGYDANGNGYFTMIESAEAALSVTVLTK